MESSKFLYLVSTPSLLVGARGIADHVVLAKLGVLTIKLLAPCLRPTFY